MDAKNVLVKLKQDFRDDDKNRTLYQRGRQVEMPKALATKLEKDGLLVLEAPKPEPKPEPKKKGSPASKDAGDKK